MKLAQLKNGYIVVKSTKKNEYEYATTSSTYTMGIYNNGALVSSGVCPGDGSNKRNYEGRFNINV